ncbi:MAG: hypothetical protein QOH73_2122 [Gaiellaceae bacterium]|jgi:chitodextrinase|nr:hypothetical protein [Gaiellaceae bacterium]
MLAALAAVVGLYVIQGATAASPVPLRINAGGPAYTDPSGNGWAADKAYAAGSWGYDTSYGTTSTTHAVAGTTTPALYQTANTFSAWTGYRIDIANGTYSVTLKMLEDWANAAGQRKFDVRIEGIQVLTAFDIFAACGAYTACDRTFTTTVSDGQLNVQFNMNGGANYGTVSALQVTGSGGGGDTTPPSAPTGLSSPSHTSSSVSLSWTAATDNVGVTGYQVLRNGAQVGTSTSTSYTDSGLAASTSYSYTVRATDAAGNVSAASSALGVTTSAGTSTNVALNKPATASSTENSTFPASNAVDGNASTRWSSAFSDPQWLRVDLGQTYAISRVTLTWEAAYGRAYQIQTSPDGTSWTTIYSTTTGDGGTDDLAISGTGRYIRMYGTTRGTAYGYSLYELVVNGTPQTGGDTTPPSAPSSLTSPSHTSSSVALSWGASTDNVGVTGYRVYRNGGQVGTPSGTSYTDSGLAASTTYSYTVRAVDAAGNLSAASNTLSVTTSASSGGGSYPLFAPYVDITLGHPLLQDVMSATGQKVFTLAFVLGSSAGCDPKWGAQIALNDASIMSQINAVKAAGGDIIVAFGGAAGPYLETSCSSQATLVTAYEKVIDTLGIKHLDIDIEASINVDMVNKALAQVQRERPGTTVSYTLMVQASNYGLTPALGVDVLNNAVANGVNVAIVNPMVMDFGQTQADWGDDVIMAEQSVYNQMTQIWPGISSAARYKMLGATPMIGKNDTGPVFSLADGTKLVNWANANHIGYLGFWSIARDNGGCSNVVSPTCSGIAQSTYQFTSIFRGFTG